MGASGRGGGGKRGSEREESTTQGFSGIPSRVTNERSVKLRGMGFASGGDRRTRQNTKNL